MAFRKVDEHQISNIKKFIREDLDYYSKLYAKIRKNNDEFLIYTNSVLALSGQYQIILSHNDTNLKQFKDEEDFENKRNLLGGLLLLKDQDNISSGNEEYQDKLKTYSAGLVWGHTLCKDFYHINKKMDELNAELQAKCGHQIHSIDCFDEQALMNRCELLYNLVKLIWDVEG